jgi:hypothetical protein
VEVELEMNTKCLATMLAMAGVSLSAQQSAPAQKATVTVCMNTDQRALMGVRPLASSMFASIGVRIDWREGHSCPAWSGVVHLSLSHGSASLRQPNPRALAYAEPYQRNIVVLLDRVQALVRNGSPSILILAHVLVHEITHVLEGVERHSPEGIMKARWSDDDLVAMRSKPLPFSEEDINLIYAGLQVLPAAPAGEVTRTSIAAK